MEFPRKYGRFIRPLPEKKQPNYATSEIIFPCKSKCEPNARGLVPIYNGYPPSLLALTNMDA